MKYLEVPVLVACTIAAFPSISLAQGKAALAREAAEYVMRQFGKEAADVGVDTLARKIELLAVEHGDDAFLAVRQIGPRALRIVEEAGEHGLESVKLMAKFGDDSLWVVASKNRLSIFSKFGDNAAESMIKHGEIAEPLLSKFGKPVAGALKAVDSQNARRLAMMAEKGELAQIGRTPELLEIVEKYGNRAMNFIWQNKGALTVSAALTAFLVNPEPFLDGVTDITKIAAENAVKPVADASGEVARNTNWTIVLVCSVVVLGLLATTRHWLRRRAK